MKNACSKLLSMACGLAFLSASDVQGQWSTTGNALAADGILGSNSGSNFGILFRTNGTERMRLDNTGKLMMGMTSVPAGGGGQTSLLYLKQSFNDWIQFRRSADNGYWSFANSSSGTPTWNMTYTPTGSTTVYPMLSVNWFGNLGVGDVFATQMNGKINMKQNTGDWIQLYRTQDVGYWGIQNATSGTMMSFNFTPATGPALPNRLVLHTNGKVSIGTTNCPGTYGLYVATGILTEKVKVALISSADWADHVFAPNYSLMPLKEVGEYISRNGHLPGVPSAEEMVQEGLDVAKTDAMLMAKIEELTLYVLQLQAELEQLKENAAISR